MNNHIHVAKIGLGSVTFGREINENASFKLMDHAMHLGLTAIDTAAAYGGGASESIVGKWLTARNLKARISIATKILPPYTPESIAASIDASLQRLQLDTVDLLYLHRWDDTIRQPEAWAELTRLQQQGKFRSIGVSNFNEAQLDDTIKLLRNNDLLPVSCVQNNHNLAVSDVTGGMAELCRENNICIVTYSPLGAGFLTGKHINGVQQNSRFAIMPAHQDIYSNQHAQRRLHKLLRVAAHLGTSPALLAMAWALHQPHVNNVLVGGRTVEHLDLAARAMKFYLPEIFAELESI